MKELSSLGKAGRARRRDPLIAELQNDAYVTEATLAAGKGAARRARTAAEQGKTAERQEFLSEDLSRRLLAQAREQQAEIEQESVADVASEGRAGGAPIGVAGPRGLGRQVAQQRRDARRQRARTDDSEDDDDVGSGAGLGAALVGTVDRDDEEDDMGAAAAADAQSSMEAMLASVTAEDEKALELFMTRDPATKRRTLADIIAEKIKEKETEIATISSEISKRPTTDINPKVIAVYQGVGRILEKYRSGAMPKAFKIVPSLNNWEEILYLTNPDLWSPQAVFQATRLFASNLKDKLAQRFYNLILLPRCRQDFEATKKLNYHLYMALKKALYKPAAFFKGILLPLCEEGNCSLREAAIIGSIITKVSIPVLHSAAAMLKIAEMEYSGTNSLFLRILLDKKYALPFRVVDAVVNHFLRFQNDERAMPVLWHQALLVFAQRYKEDMALEQKEALLELLRYQRHPTITDDVRRELIHSKCRGDEEAPLGEEALRARAERLARLAMDEEDAEEEDAMMAA